MTRSEAPLPLGQGETILLVDDERPLVLLGEEMLAAIGYEPIGFDESSAALAAFRADPDRFDLVLTDELMPEMTGTELAIALHEIRPDLPIILMTGHGGRVESRRLRCRGHPRGPQEAAAVGRPRQRPRPASVPERRDGRRPCAVEGHELFHSIAACHRRCSPEAGGAGRFADIITGQGPCSGP